MKKSTQLIQTISDIVATGTGAICLMGAAQTFSPHLFPILLWLSLVLGGIAGLTYGFTTSQRPRRFAGYMIWTMCVLQLIVQLRLATLGAYWDVAMLLTIYSVAAIVLILCWIANQWTSTRVTQTTLLTMKQSLSRLLFGMICFVVAFTLVVGTFYMIGFSTARLMLAALYMTWYVSICVCCANQFWTLTSDANRHRGAFERSPANKFALIGFFCGIISIASYAMQNGDPTIAGSTLSLTVAAIVTAIVIRHDFAAGKNVSAISA